MNDTTTKLQVRLFLGNKEITQSELDKITISNITINRIVNEIVEKVSINSTDATA